MWPYWFFFLIPAVAALSAKQSASQGSFVNESTPSILAVFGLFTAFIIGFRYQVGGDWVAYLGYLYVVSDLDFYEAMSLSDPGYQLLNWISSELGWGIRGVNTLCGLIFSLGLIRYVSRLPRPWLALTIATPYMIIIVAMGYSRQSVALGMVMLALTFLSVNRNIMFILAILIAATAHKSAILLIPIAMLVNSKSKFQTIVTATLGFVVGYLTLLDDAVDKLVGTYIGGDMQSEGAIIRILMCVVPSLIFLFKRDQMGVDRSEFKLYSLFSYASVAGFLLIFILSASTAVDRMALYLLPIQLFVFSRLPDLFSEANRKSVEFLVIIYFAAVLLVWLNFASHRYAWLPYRLML